MVLAFQILGLIFATAIGLIVLALVMPLRLELQVSRQDALTYSAALRPFGRFGPQISLSDRRDKSKATRKQQRRKPFRSGIGKLQPKPLVQAAIRLVAELFALVRVETATLELQFGLGDPGDTGQVYGLMTPLIYGTSGQMWGHVTIKPVFDQATLTGRASLDLSLVPARLVVPFVRFGWAAFGPMR